MSAEELEPTEGAEPSEASDDASETTNASEAVAGDAETTDASEAPHASASDTSETPRLRMLRLRPRLKPLRPRLKPLRPRLKSLRSTRLRRRSRSGGARRRRRLPMTSRPRLRNLIRRRSGPRWRRGARARGGLRGSRRRSCGRRPSTCGHPLARRDSSATTSAARASRTPGRSSPTRQRAVANDWSKLLESAVANAEHNHELVGEDLYVKAVTADEGPTIKRFRPRAKGRATKIRKRTAHLTILLTPKD